MNAKKLICILTLFFSFNLVALGATPYIEVKFNRIDLTTGVTLEYVEKGRTSGEVVIFIHGWLDSWYSWQQVLNKFPKKYHSYAITMRGHGLSDKPADGYKMQDYASDIHAFMNQLSIKKAHLVGHSMGTTIAQQFAISFPERVKKIVLLGAIANAAGNSVLQSIKGLVDGLTDPVDQDLVREFVEGLFINMGDPLFVDRLVREELLVTANTWHKGLGGLLVFDARNQLHRIKAKTLVIYGDGDQLFSLKEQKDLLDGIPNSSFLIWKNTGHAMHWEDPVRAVADISDFLKGKNGGDDD